MKFSKGDKVIPISKTVGGELFKATTYKRMQTKELPCLIVNGHRRIQLRNGHILKMYDDTGGAYDVEHRSLDPGDVLYLCDISPENGGGDYYLEEDLLLLSSAKNEDFLHRLKPIE